MSKEVKVQQIQPDENGPVFGQVSNPADFVKSQLFAHQHTEIMARDFVVGGCEERAVAGFDLSLLGGMQIRIAAPGQVIGTDGKSYELIGSAQVDIALADSDPDLARIDIVVAVLESDVDAASELRPFARLRTQAEKDEGIAPYSPQQFNQPTEKHTRAVLQVKEGVPGANPAAQHVAPDEELLYTILVPAASTQIDKVNVIDNRHKVASNCVLQDLINDLGKRIDRLPQKHRHNSDEVDNHPGSPAYDLGTTVQDALDTLALRTKPTPIKKGVGAVLRPEILTPEVAPYDVNANKLGSIGALISGVPTVKIPYPREVVFSTGTFTVEPNAFEDQALNPRLINDDPEADDQSLAHVVEYSLSEVQVVQTDGGGNYELKGYQLPVDRVKRYAGGRLAAARDNRYIEVFGGAPSAGDSSWRTIDTVQSVVTDRAYIGTYPQEGIIGCWPCGNGKILVAQQVGPDAGANGGKLEWFLVDAATPNGVTVKIDDGPGSSEELLNSAAASGVVGDLIAPNRILLLINATAVSQNTLWVYKVDVNQFEQLTPLGPNPLQGLALNQILEHVDMCCYKEGQAVLVRGIGAATYIFDYASRTWSQLQIPQPYADAPGAFTATLWGVTLANVDGRVHLTSETSSVWELVPGVVPTWQQLATTVAPRGHNGLVGMLQNGLPRGKGYLIGGRVSNAPKKDIWEFKALGVIQTICQGQTALTLAPNTRSATIRVADFQIPWQVASVLITLRGDNLQGRVRVSESFDNGDSFQDIPLNSDTPISNSNANPNRQLFITLTGTESVRPCLIMSREVFFKVGGLGGSMVYLVYDAPNAQRFLFMDDKGKITLEVAAAETTKTKAIFHRVTPDGDDPPIVFDYINKYRIERKYEGDPQVGGVAPTIPFDFSVLPDFIQCWKIEADGTVKLLEDCAVIFNGNITVNGLANGQSFRVHLAG